MRVGGTQQHAAYSVRHFRTGRSDLLTARFGVRISVPEPILNLRLRCERLRASAVHPLYILRTSIDAGQTATVLLRVLELRRSHSYWGHGPNRLRADSESSASVDSRRPNP